MRFSKPVNQRTKRPCENNDRYYTFRRADVQVEGKRRECVDCNYNISIKNYITNNFSIKIKNLYFY